MVFLVLTFIVSVIVNTSLLEITSFFEKILRKDVIGYSMITALSEKSTSEKGGILMMTYDLLHGKGSYSRSSSKNVLVQKETIYLVDEVDVFFGSEILLMIDHVKKIEDEPYYIDKETGFIGYKVMDTISYNINYGYTTIFAYLKEAGNGNLKNKDKRLADVICMPLSCGQFSYANIKPNRILGVSGTLKEMGSYEKDLHTNYGINKFIYVPSVYSQSNFKFDKVGEGVIIDSEMSVFSVITNVSGSSPKATFMENWAGRKIFSLKI